LRVSYTQENEDTALSLSERDSPAFHDDRAIDGECYLLFSLPEKIQSPIMIKNEMVTIATNADPVKDWIVFANSFIGTGSIIASFLF